MNCLNQYEITALDWIAEHIRCEFLDEIMPAISSLADAGIFWIALTLVLLLFKKTRNAGITMAIALVLGLAFGNGVLKPLVARIRPYDVNPEAVLIIDRLTDYSFPSGHTLASFEGAVGMFLWNKKLGIPALILALLIAFSRVYLYVHYPVDVIAGALLGTAFAFIGYFTVKKLRKNQHYA